jgi:hypothetical protein
MGRGVSGRVASLTQQQCTHSPFQEPQGYKKAGAQDRFMLLLLLLLWLTASSCCRQCVLPRLPGTPAAAPNLDAACRQMHRTREGVHKVCG